MTTFKRVRRFGSWVTFLLLEAISLMLVVEYNQYQSQIFAHSANVFTGSVNKKAHSVWKFFSANSTNQQLMAENARLKTELKALQGQVAAADSSSNSPSSALHRRYCYIPANVISKTLQGQNNYFTIDRGINDSIAIDMGVIGQQGIVGIVTNVSRNYAKVMTLLHPQTRISASIKGLSYFGSLFWDGRDANYMVLEDIPKDAAANKGDTIITSGYSNIFPANIALGTIEKDTIMPGDGGRTISVKLINELASTTYVYVIRDFSAAELKNLDAK